jgi:uncharacterized protein (DUF1684 family)
MVKLFRHIVMLFILLTPSLMQGQTYAEEMSQWDSARVKYLKAETGWLNLAGLFWLQDGKNTFGTAPGNNIVFPKGSVPDFAGSFEVKDGMVKMILDPATNIKVRGQRYTSAVVFHPDSSSQPVVSSGNYRWNIIKRENKFAIRLRNLDHPALSSFKGIERFPIDPSWKIVAKLEKGSSTMSFKNVLGQTITQESPGRLVFNVNDQRFSLDALWEGEQLYIIFGDETTGASTYPSGRYLYAAKPDSNGNTVLDFNKSINPPCAFTEFATCPIPPKQNWLPIAINAGEKNYDGH